MGERHKKSRQWLLSREDVEVSLSSCPHFLLQTASYHRAGTRRHVLRKANSGKFYLYEVNNIYSLRLFRCIYFKKHYLKYWCNFGFYCKAAGEEKRDSKIKLVLPGKISCSGTVQPFRNWVKSIRNLGKQFLFQVQQNKIYYIRKTIWPANSCKTNG